MRPSLAGGPERVVPLSLMVLKLRDTANLKANKQTEQKNLTAKLYEGNLELFVPFDLHFFSYHRLY